MIGKIVNILKSILPEFLYNGLKVIYKGLKPILKSLHTFYFIIKLIKVQANHKKALEIVRKKGKIKVIFLLIQESVWKYEGVYGLMRQHERFEPIVVGFESYCQQLTERG